MKRKMNEREHKKGNTWARRLRCGALAMALAVTTLASSAPAMNALAEKSTETYEGEGFATPEEAVTAYLEAMKDGDVKQMLSCFAVESYVDHVDAEANIGRMQVFMGFVSADQMPMVEGYPREVLVAKRYGDLATDIYLQMLQYACTLSGAGDPTQSVALKDETEISAFCEKMKTGETELAAAFSAMEIASLDPAEVLGDNWNPEMVEGTLERTRGYLNADEMRSMPTLLNLGDEGEWVFLPDCVRYGEKWYMSELFGTAAMMGNLTTFTGGLALKDSLAQ